MTLSGRFNHAFTDGIHLGRFSTASKKTFSARKRFNRGNAFPEIAAGACARISVFPAEVYGFYPARPAEAEVSGAASFSFFRAACRPIQTNYRAFPARELSVRVKSQPDAAVYASPAFPTPAYRFCREPSPCDSFGKADDTDRRRATRFEALRNPKAKSLRKDKATAFEQFRKPFSFPTRFV